MSDILENALDSLEMGVSHFLDKKLATRDKWAILEFFHTIELLLKERLSQENPLLIYRNIDKKIGPDSQTVGLQEILARFENLDIEISKEYRKILVDLQGRRNRIEHHRFVPDKSDRRVLGEALKFITYFLEEHLGEDLEDHLPTKHFKEVKQLVYEYDDLLRKAQSSISTARHRYDAKEQSMLDTGTCPECGHETVLITPDGEPFCHYCDEEVSVTTCDSCGSYLPAEHLTGGICQNCFDYKMSRD